MNSRKQFARHVRDALANFYDPAHLETHPLARCLVRELSHEETRGLALRELLIETIEMLRPAAVIPYNQPEWLGYRVMRQRYVECLRPDEVCEELGLGRTTYYRYHRQALAAVTDILWQRFQRIHEDEACSDDGPSLDIEPRSRAREEAAALARSSGRQRVNLSDALRDALPLLTLYARQEGIAITVSAPATLPSTYADPAMLRQIVLNLIPEAAHMAAGDTLALEVTPRESDVLWTLRGLDAVEAADCNISAVDGLAVCQGLLDVYGGRLWLECEGDEATLRLTLPTARPWAILVVDDKPEAAQLYQRYLQDLDCVLWVARDAQEVVQRLADGTPDLVLLDVLMPNEDGWSILQRLKTDPTTAAVPVVVCSVLSQPRLALAIGATAVLQKPISQEDLLRTVKQLLRREDSPATAHPATPPTS